MTEVANYSEPDSSATIQLVKDLVTCHMNLEVWKTSSRELRKSYINEEKELINQFPKLSEPFTLESKKVIYWKVGNYWVLPKKLPKKVQGSVPFDANFIRDTFRSYLAKHGVVPFSGSATGFISHVKQERTSKKNGPDEPEYTLGVRIVTGGASPFGQIMENNTTVLKYVHCYEVLSRGNSEAAAARKKSTAGKKILGNLIPTLLSKGLVYWAYKDFFIVSPSHTTKTKATKKKIDKLQVLQIAFETYIPEIHKAYQATYNDISDMENRITEISNTFANLCLTIKPLSTQQVGTEHTVAIVTEPPGGMGITITDALG